MSTTRNLMLSALAGAGLGLNPGLMAAGTREQRRAQTRRMFALAAIRRSRLAQCMLSHGRPRTGLETLVRWTSADIGIAAAGTPALVDTRE